MDRTVLYNGGQRAEDGAYEKGVRRVGGCGANTIGAGLPGTFTYPPKLGR
jgi:hypothetical protein